MPAEHQLSPAATGLFGKHPAFGDFISSGLPEGYFSTLGDWMGATLGDWRSKAGPGWEPAFDTAPPIRFWLGAGLTGQEPLRGVWRPSRDRVGRRFPLLLAQIAGMPPVCDAAQSFYERAEALLHDLAGQEAFDPAQTAVQSGAALPSDPPQPALHPPGFWAANPGLDAGALWSELALTDHLHAAMGRSYWWVSGGTGGPSAAVAVEGWPDSALLGWLISGGKPAEHHDPEEAGL